MRNGNGAACAHIGVIVIAIVAAGGPGEARGADPFRSLPSASQWMVAMELGGEPLEGLPLRWSSDRVELLARDGRLIEFAPGDAKNVRRTQRGFVSLTPIQMRHALLRAVGDEYTVTSTTHYLVAHHRTDKSRWAARFEDMYRTFDRFYRVRGFDLCDPPAPLVAVVAKDYSDFARLAAADGISVSPMVLGFYGIKTNRILLYNRAGHPMAASQDSGRSGTLQTVLHEATHQIAYNRGLHSRFLNMPFWIVEGVATGFEVQDARDVANHRIEGARPNQKWLKVYVEAKRAELVTPDVMRNLVASDTYAAVDSSFAYGMSWAWTHFLVEKRAGEFDAYLQRVASRPPFVRYGANERLADFTAIFGGNWSALTGQFERYLDEVVQIYGKESSP